MPVPQSGNQSSLCEKLGLATALPSFFNQELDGWCCFLWHPGCCVCRLALGYYLVTLNQQLRKRLEAASAASPAGGASNSQQPGLSDLLRLDSPVANHGASSAPDSPADGAPAGNDPNDLDAVHWDLLERAYDIAMRHIIDPEQKEDWPTMIAPALREVEAELSAHGTSSVQIPPAGEFLLWPGFYIQALQVRRC